MKVKNKKRILAIGVLVSVVCTAIGNPFPKTTEAAMPQYEGFKETFDSVESMSDWSSTTDQDFSTLLVNKTFKSSDEDTADHVIYVNPENITVSDYTVACDVMFEKVDGKEPATTISAGIVARVNSSSPADTGYEFQMQISNGTVYGKLRDRKNNFDVLTQNNVRLEKELYNTPHQLKIQIYGATIKCYIDGMLMDDLTLTDSTYTSGTAEIRLRKNKSALNVNTVCDNFKVYQECMFCDDFSGYTADTNTQNRNMFESNGWYVESNLNAGFAKTGAYVVPADNTSQHVFIQTQNGKGALGWNDYSVEADITIGISETDELNTDVIASVTGRHVDTSGNGYEVQLYVPKSGASESKIRIYQRGVKDVETLAVPFPVVLGETYNLKAVFQDDTIYAYVNGQLVLTANSQAYPIGYAGIRRTAVDSKTACGVDVKFDNFVVYEYDESPAMFSETFDKYEAGKASNTAMNANGWDATNNKASYNTGTAFAIPANIATQISLSNHSTAAQWTNYAIEAKITLDSQTGTSGTTFAAIMGRLGDKEGKTGYLLQFQEGFNGTEAILKLKTGSKTLYTTEAIQSVLKDIPHTLRMEFQGTLIKCYLNGNLVISYDTVNDDTKYTSGYAGIKKIETTGRTVSFDDFKVYDLDNPYEREIVGDINGNTAVNDLDTESLRSQLLEDTQSAACDVNKNSEIDICDLAREKKLVYSLQD